MEPLRRLQFGHAAPQPRLYVSDVPAAAEGHAESRQAVIDDVRVSIIEPGQHGAAVQSNDTGGGAAQPEDLVVPDRENDSACCGKVGRRPQAHAAQRIDVPTHEDQLGLQRAPKQQIVDSWAPRTRLNGATVDNWW